MKDYLVLKCELEFYNLKKLGIPFHMLYYFVHIAFRVRLITSKKITWFFVQQGIQKSIFCIVFNYVNGMTS